MSAVSTNKFRIMQNKTNKLMEQAKKIMGENSDFMIICHKEGHCGAVTHGDTETIAQAIFSCMHQPDNPIGQTIYRILKMNVMNIITNPSPYTVDFVDTLATLFHKINNQEDEK